MTLQDFVDALKRERMEKGWTQYRLAKESGVSRERIAKLESGRHSPTLLTVDKLCNALGFEIVLTKKGGRK